MAIISKKKHKPKKNILFIDDDELICSRIKKYLLPDARFSYHLSRSCSISEIQNCIDSGQADVIFFGLKISDPRCKLVSAALSGTGKPPVIGMKTQYSSRLPSAVKCKRFLCKTSLRSELIIDTIHTVLDDKKGGSGGPELVADLQNYEFRLLNSILDSPDGIVICDKKGKIFFANTAACAMLYGDDKVNRFKSLIIDFGGTTSKELIAKTGKILDLRSTEISWNGQHVMLLSIRDITMRKHAEEALRESEKRYELAIKGSKDGLWDWDLKTDACHFNMRWNDLVGIGGVEFRWNPKIWFSKIHSLDLSRFKKRLSYHIKGETDTFECEYRIRHTCGNWIWMSIKGECSRDYSGKAIRITGLQSDITERKKAEKQLKKSLDELRFALASEKILMEELDKKNKELIELSITDGLTGLYNHRFLQERFDFEYKRIKRYGGIISCMMIDIDHFKMTNDTYGHQFGDQVLRQLSKILKSNSREVDICGRYGGEEFMIVTNMDAEETLKFASKLHAAIEKHEFDCGEKKIHITVSIGIAECKTDIQSKQELVERADSALYKAKRDGRNLIRVWKAIEYQDEQLLDMGSFEIMKGKFIDLSNQMRATYIESTNALVKAVDAKDPFAKEHSHNVSRYSTEIARAMQLPENDIEVIGYAGLLHDVGKISVNEEILIKKDALTPKEFEVLKHHPEAGVNILRDMKFLEKEIPLILHHHERYDGKGYPYGLKGREIPVGARIIAVADSIDAMTSGRTYKKRLSWKDALQEIRKGSGTQFAPDIVDAAINVFENEKIRQISRFANTKQGIIK
jgi:diguanylate cyclase (GGDEF)-like protein/PAS domain S-box-containing protein/putative nucleotidyltransferase with HDIG domain